MARRSYSRDDVQTHTDGYRDSLPAVNVKVYGTINNAWAQFEREERDDGDTDIYINDYEWAKEEQREQERAARMDIATVERTS